MQRIPGHCLLCLSLIHIYVNGVDYTQLEPLKELTNTDQHQEDKALEYKAAALEELSGTVDFPVTAVMPYSTGNLGLTNRVQVEEQQLEGVLGTDYIDVVLVPYPPTNYLKESRSCLLYTSRCV